MDRDDEQQLLRRRFCGADHDHPGPRTDRRYAELVGGPLDGLLLFSELEAEVVEFAPPDPVSSVAATVYPLVIGHPPGGSYRRGCRRATCDRQIAPASASTPSY